MLLTKRRRRRRQDITKSTLGNWSVPGWCLARVSLHTSYLLESVPLPRRSGFACQFAESPTRDFRGVVRRCLECGEASKTQTLEQ